jgi:hypothetical protein
MSPHNEEQKTLDAVNEAAREAAREDTHERGDDWRVETAGIVVVKASDPDLHILIGNRNRMYSYQVTDVAGGLGSKCCGRLPAAFDSYSCCLYAVVNALQSISNHKALERLCQRYGFNTRRAARESRKRLRVTIVTPDTDLNGLASTLSDAADPLSMLACLGSADVTRYTPLVEQLQRFECSFESAGVYGQRVNQLRSWAAFTLKQAEHDGPIQSPAFRVQLAQAAASPASPAIPAAPAA